MEKERQMQCVPTELLDRLRGLAARLWEEKSPGAVHLSALMEEFGAELRTLGSVLKQYEEEYVSQLAVSQNRFGQKEARLRKEIEDLKSLVAKGDAEKLEMIKRQAELRSHLAACEKTLAGLKEKTAEEEGELNAKYVASMEELYGKVNKREREILARWEDKNRYIETKTLEMEAAFSMREKQLKIREKNLEDDFNARKMELIKTFDRIRDGLEAREKALAEREAQTPAKGGGI